MGTQNDYEREAIIRASRLKSQEALSEYLQGYAWDAFITGTFKRQIHHPRQAMGLVYSKLKIIPVTFASVYEEPLPYVPTTWVRRTFLAAEPHKLGGWHCHGLIEFFHREPGDTEGLILEARGQLGSLGWSRVEAMRNIGGVAGYCSKYLTKELGDYDFYGQWHYKD
jgi:hypothetical protein